VYLERDTIARKAFSTEEKVSSSFFFVVVCREARRWARC
jgi:hypothetical protein